MKTIKYALITVFVFLFLSLKVVNNKGEYKVPLAAHSVCSYDINNDGDYDIVIGNSYTSITEWGGVSILENSGNGYFDFNDSMYFENGFPEVDGNYFDNDDYIDIFSRTVTSDPYSINISIIYNYGLSLFDSIKSFPIYPEPPVPFITCGDVNGDGFKDLLFAHNNDFLWGIIYNDGTGNFSSPEYYDLTFPPVDISCGDLNEDGRDDVVLCGTTTEIYFSTETGFQQQVLTTTLSHDVLISDFDNDGDNDVITHTTYIYPNHRVYMFENLGNNQFIEHDYFQFSPFCSYAQIADFNNDSLPDMVFIDSDHTGLHLYQNLDNFNLDFQQFISIPEITMEGMYCLDYDNNGFIDIAASYGFGLDFFVKILFNDGMGGFQENPITIIKPADLLLQNPIQTYPNPFNKKLTIEFKVSNNNITSLEIYDINGKLIKTVFNELIKTGVYEYIWNSEDENGKEVTNGIYFIRLISGRKVFTQKVMKIK